MKKQFLALLVNIFAMNSFSYITALPIEVFIAGMTFNQHLQIRFTSIFSNSITAYPYDLWRKFILSKKKVNNRINNYFF
jgi:hypothetical protein